MNIEFLVARFVCFPVSILNMSHNFLLVLIALDEKLHVKLIKYMLGHLSLAAFKILSLPLSFSKLIRICVNVGLCVYPSWNSLSFFDVQIDDFIKFRKFSALFLQLVFLPQSLLAFWDSHYTYIGTFVTVSLVS